MTRFGDVAVEDVPLVAVEWPSRRPGRRGAVMPDSSQRPLSSVNASVAMVSPDAMPGRCCLLRGVVAAVDQRVGREHDRGEVRRAQQRTAHLLEHDDELDVGVAGAAEVLGHDEALQTELLAHLPPHGVVVALLGRHELAHGLSRATWSSRNCRTMRRSSSCSSLNAKFIATAPASPDARPT